MGKKQPATDKVPKINSWKPTRKSQVLIEPDDKSIIIYFDKKFHPKTVKYNRFFIAKNSYINQLPIITKYTNFFMNCYDPDDSLITAYLKIKHALDRKRAFTAENMDSYIEFIYEILFTDDIIQKINQLVDDNYLDDIEVDLEEKRKKYQKNEKKHLESLEFTNQHIKILLRISFGIKIMTPVLFHYFVINEIKLDKKSDVIYKFYKPLFDIFGVVEKFTDRALITNDGFFYVYNDATQCYDRYEEASKRMVLCNVSPETIERKLTGGELHEAPRDYIAEYNLYNKLYVYVKAKVNECYSNNTPIFDQQEIFGVDIYSVIHAFTRRVLISENVVKYKFNAKWNEKKGKYDENINGFNKTIIKYQLMYFIKEQYPKNLTEVSNNKSTADGLSGGDKMMMNLTKIDEGITIMADLNIPFTMNMLMKRFDIQITEDEIDYYMRHHNPDAIQRLLVLSYFANFFGSYRDLNLLRRRDYMILMLILKKKLTIELGYSIDEEDAEIRPMALPYIISANSSDHINTRIIRNGRFIEKVKESYTFDKLQKDNHKYLNFIKPDYDLEILSSCINTKYTYVEYYNKKLLGEEIVYGEDKISSELMFFLTTV